MEIKPLTAQIDVVIDNEPLNAKIIELKNQIKELESEKSELQKQLETSQEENTELENRIENLDAQILDLQTELQNLQDDLDNLNGEIVTDKSKYALETKNLIADAIKNKGGTITPATTFRSYANEIDNIELGDLNTIGLFHFSDNFFDSSVYKWSVSSIGNPIITNDVGSPFSETGNSLYLNGNSLLNVDNVRFPQMNDVTFTFEFFVYKITDTFDNMVFFAKNRNSSGYRFGHISGSNIGLYSQGINTTVSQVATINVQISHSLIQKNHWTHIAVCRSMSNIIYIFVNGVLQKSTNYKDYTVKSLATPYNTGFTIGALRTDKYLPFKGYMSELIVSSICRYTADFTPPTEPFSV